MQSFSRTALQCLISKPFSMQLFLLFPVSLFLSVSCQLKPIPLWSQLSTRHSCCVSYSPPCVIVIVSSYIVHYLLFCFLSSPTPPLSPLLLHLLLLPSFLLYFLLSAYSIPLSSPTLPPIVSLFLFDLCQLIHWSTCIGMPVYTRPYQSYQGPIQVSDQNLKPCHTYMLKSGK